MTFVKVEDNYNIKYVVAIFCELMKTIIAPG
jgi:hypothetical protein